MARQGCAGGADTPAVLGDCVSAAGWAAGLGSARDPDAQLSYGDQLSSAGRKPDSTAVWPASWRWAWRPIPALPLPAGDKALDGYSKKKYVCKLLFIFLLGHAHYLQSKYNSNAESTDHVCHHENLPTHTACTICIKTTFKPNNKKKTYSI